jgi:hypothetical protein
MKIDELKNYLCELIEESYQTARFEGHQEIMHPFVIVLKGQDEVEFVSMAPLRQKAANHAWATRKSL